MKNNETIVQPGALVRHETSLPARTGLAGINVELLITKAIDSKAAVEVVKELRAMAMEDQALRARHEFDAAMRAFQSDCPVIIKNVGVKDNSNKVAYSYAPIEDVEVKIRPFCQKHGFSHKFPKMILGEGTVTAYCEVKHDGGHSELTEVTYRVAAGTRMMSTTQVDAATETFAKRRALCNAYGLILAGEDLDGRSAQREKPAGPSALAGAKMMSGTDVELKRRLVDLTRGIHFCKGYNMDEDGKAKLTQYLVDEAILSDTETISDLAGARLAEVVKAVEKKLQS